MMRHGFRGAAEIAATLDHLGAFAHLAGAVPPQLFDLYHDATLGQPEVRAFLASANPAALAAMEARFAALAKYNGTVREIDLWAAEYSVPPSARWEYYWPRLAKWLAEA